jgi:hypothetical protein
MSKDEPKPLSDTELDSVAGGGHKKKHKDGPSPSNPSYPTHPTNPDWLTPDYRGGDR